MSIVLENERLRVEMVEPEVEPNNTQRFDRAGYITRVTLDGKHHFGVMEPPNYNRPSTGGFGLASEYVLEQPSLDAKIGEYFIKPGVGLLKKYEDAPYHIFKRYEFKPIVTTFTAAAQSVDFVTEPVPCLGYAFRTRKHIEIAENHMVMDISVENCGEKPMALEEFDHNFVTIDYLPTGPNYYLAMPIRNQDGRTPNRGTLIGKGSGFTFTGYNEIASRIDILGEEIDRSVPFTWKLTNAMSPASITGEVSFAPSKVILWCVTCIVSPEVYTSVTIQPGETASWQRRWTFDD